MLTITNFTLVNAQLNPPEIFHTMDQDEEYPDKPTFQIKKEKKIRAADQLPDLKSEKQANQLKKGIAKGASAESLHRKFVKINEKKMKRGVQQNVQDKKYKAKSDKYSSFNNMCLAA